MKKCITIVLILTSVIGFAGCGNNEDKKAAEKSPESAQTQVSTESRIDDSNAESEDIITESSEESIYISDDPNEYVKYLGQWLPTGGENCIMEITYPDDKEYSITINSSDADFNTEWVLTGVFEAENGGIHYSGTVKEKMSDGTEQTRDDCEGFLRLGEDGFMKWRDSKDTRGNNIIFKRTDT